MARAKSSLPVPDSPVMRTGISLVATWRAICPARRIDRELPEEALCDTWKYNLEPMLEIVAASRYQPTDVPAPVAEEQS